jgi:hypothetical protein
MFNKFYADMEAMRETQRRRAEEAKSTQSTHRGGDKNGGQWGANSMDLAKAQQSVQSAGVKAGAYVSSWVSWAGEKRKAAGWGAKSPGASASGGGGGWGLGGGRNKAKSDNNGFASPTATFEEKEYRALGNGAGSRMSGSSSAGHSAGDDDNEKARRPLTQDSFTESLFSAGTESAPASPRKNRPLSGDNANKAVPLDSVAEGRTAAFYKDDDADPALSPRNLDEVKKIGGAKAQATPAVKADTTTEAAGFPKS